MHSVYDVTRRDTFDNIEVWLQELGQYAGSADVVKMLVGNKSDLVWECYVGRLELGSRCVADRRLKKKERLWLG